MKRQAIHRERTTIHERTVTLRIATLGDLDAARNYVRLSLRDTSMREEWVGRALDSLRSARRNRDADAGLTYGHPVDGGPLLVWERRYRQAQVSP